MLTMGEALPIMKKLLSEGRLSIFAGSGISVDSGLPEWDGFIDEYIKICETLNRSLSDSLKFTKIIEDAKTNKKKDLIGTVTALKEKIKECKKNTKNQRRSSGKVGETPRNGEESPTFRGEPKH